MIGDNGQGGNTAGRREWIEPEVSELKVAETENLPFRGADGGRFADCTRS